MLSLIDILLRINWLVLGLLSAVYSYFGMVAWCVVLIALSTAINLLLWRRYFRLKYDILRYDFDFIKHTFRYPLTTSTIMFLSNAFSFQAFRLFYSRMINKK